MEASLNINVILSEVKKLDKEDQVTLLQNLMLLVYTSEEPRNYSIRLSSISGLGSDLWKHVKVDKYIDEERQW